LTPRRFAALAAGLCLLTLPVLGLSGCSGRSGPPTSGASGSAKNALVASITPLATTSYAISLTAGSVSAIGAIDPVSHTASVTAQNTATTAPAKVSVLMIDSDSWAKVDPGTHGRMPGVNPAKWLKLDPTKLTPASLPFDASDLTDAFDLRHLMQGILTVSRTDDRHYSGSIDLTGAQGVNSLIPAGRALGSTATDVPFTATLDGQGRLTDFAAGSTVAGAVGFDFGISDYAAAAPPERPNDDQVTTAPNSVYPLLKD
jgi:hypothetical protein